MPLASRLAPTAVALAAATSLMAAPASAVHNAPIASDALSNTVARITSDGTGYTGVCTDAAISATEILTARHCVETTTPRSVTAPDGSVLPVTSYRKGNDSDVAILTLGRAWTGSIAQTTTAPTQNGQTLTVYGKGGPTDGVTRKATATVLFNEQSTSASNLYDAHLAVGNIANGARMIQGDSGGPLFNAQGEIQGVSSGLITTGGEMAGIESGIFINPLSLDPSIFTSTTNIPVRPSNPGTTPTNPGTITPQPSPTNPDSGSTETGSSLDAGSIIGIITAFISLLGVLGGHASQFGLI